MYTHDREDGIVIPLQFYTTRVISMNRKENSRITVRLRVRVPNAEYNHMSDDHEQHRILIHTN